MDPALRTPVSRRRILLGIGGLALADTIGVAGCATTVSPPTETSGGLPAGDTAAARDAVVRATALAAAYRTAAGRHPSLRFLFDPLRAHHEVAMSALGAQVPAAVATSPPAGTNPAASAPAGVAATAGGVDESPTARAATLASLRATESRASAAARTDSLRVSGLLAPSLASLHAAGVAQVELLDLYLAQVNSGRPAATAGSIG